MGKIKKGSIIDIIIIVALIVAFSIAALVGFKILDAFNTEIQASGVISDIDKNNDVRNSLNDIRTVYTTSLDSSFLFLIIGLSIGALALAFMVRFHPVFFVFFIILFIIIMVLSTVFSNLYLEMANQPELSSLAGELTFITSLMKLLPFIVGIVGFLMAIVMYKNWSADQQ